MKKKTILMITGAVLVLALIGAWAFWPDQSASATTDLSTAEYVTLETGTLEATVGATGKVRARQSAVLVWDTSGKVESVHVSDGETVSEGDVLAELAQTSLPQSVILAQADLIAAQEALDDLMDSADALAIAEAERNLANAREALDEKEEEWEDINYTGTQDEIDKASRDLQKAYTELKDAEAERDRYDNPNSRNYKMAQAKYLDAYNTYATELGDYNYYTGQTVDEYERAVSQADLAVARQEVAEAEEAYQEVLGGVSAEDVTAAKAKVAAAEANLKQAWIEAPFSGTITSVDVLPGDLVSQKEQAFILNDLNTLLVDLEISEVDINQIKVGQQVTISFDAIPVKQYQGEVVEVSIDGIDSQGVVDFPVVVEITNADGDIRLGMTASVDILVVQDEEALLVPNQAIRVEEGTQVVYTVNKQGEIEAVPVVLGFSSSAYSEVLDSTLAAGDEIIQNPAVVLAQGGAMNLSQIRNIAGDNAPQPGGMFGGGEE